MYANGNESLTFPNFDGIPLDRFAVRTIQLPRDDEDQLKPFGHAILM